MTILAFLYWGFFQGVLFSFLKLQEPMYVLIHNTYKFLINGIFQYKRSIKLYMYSITAFSHYMLWKKKKNQGLQQYDGTRPPQTLDRETPIPRRWISSTFEKHLHSSPSYHSFRLPHSPIHWPSSGIVSQRMHTWPFISSTSHIHCSQIQTCPVSSPKDGTQ